MELRHWTLHNIFTHLHIRVQKATNGHLFLLQEELTELLYASGS